MTSENAMMKRKKTRVEEAREGILAMIESGAVGLGEQMESERELALRFGMNSRTVRKALQELEEEGIVEKRARVGNFVRDIRKVEGIGVVFPSYFLGENQQHIMTGLVLNGVNDALDARRYALNSYSYRPGYFWEDVGVLLGARKVRGVVLLGNWKIKAEEVRRVLDGGTEVVLLSSHWALLDLGLSAFYNNGRTILSQLLGGLLERGHQDIVVVRYSHPRSGRRMLLELQERYGLEENEDMLVTVPNADNAADYSVLDQIFERRRMPTAVVAPDEVVAGHLFRACYKRGIRVPEDMSLVASSDLTPHAHPVPLTAPETIKNHQWLAKRAMEQLLAQIDGSGSRGVCVSKSGDVHWRESVRILPKREKVKC